MRAFLIWSGLVTAIALPLVVAAMSPLLQWREPVYVGAGFAGIVGLALMVVQPLLAGNELPGIRGRTWHRLVGLALVASVLLHVAGLWVTSPPDVIDVLLFRSPTPFGVWGAIAMWAVFIAGALAIFRRSIRPAFWRLLHTSAVVIAVGATVAHAVLIEGTMGAMSKVFLCVLVVALTLRTVIARRAWSALRPRRA